jgi:hypothetical protein
MSSSVMLSVSDRTECEAHSGVDALAVSFSYHTVSRGSCSASIILHSEI